MGGQACVFYGAAQVSKDVDLAHALADDEAALLPALDAEMPAEQAVDRAYWEPVRRELEAMWLDEARQKPSPEQTPGESL
jgi:hypothetical protein